MDFNTQNGFTPETWSVIGICLGVALIVYRMTMRRSRRRRLIAIELRIESAWQDMKASLRFAGSTAKSHRPVGMASAFLGGLHAGPQGRVLSMRPLNQEGVEASDPMAMPAVASTGQPGVPRTNDSTH